MQAYSASYPPRKILFPTDLTELSLEAYPYILSVTEGTGAELTILYLADTIEAGLSQPIPLLGKEALEHRLLGSAASRMARMFPNTDVLDPEPKVHLEATSDISETICRYAQEGNFDWIVMPTHGRSGWSRYLSGSITEETQRRAPCPVLIIRTGLENPKSESPSSDPAD